VTVAIIILTGLLSIYIFVWALVLWMGERIGRRWAEFDGSRADAVLRAKERVAVHQTYGSFIEMPEQLSTRDEMVDWMTNELPRLAVEKQKPSA
jgi:hypothetical protein